LKEAQDENAPLMAGNCEGKALQYGKEKWSGKSTSQADFCLWGSATYPV
jgi:hypothetical protein